MAHRNGSATLAPPRRPQVSWTEDTYVVFDATALTGTQRSGMACVSCSKKWPRPRRVVGVLPDGTSAKACTDCADNIAESLTHHAVRHVLRRAGELAERHAPDIVAALIAAEPKGYGHGPRRAVETAALLVAQHIAATELLVGQERLPAEITEWEHAYAWLAAWRDSGPPVAVLREVLRAVLDEHDGRSGG